MARPRRLSLKREPDQVLATGLVTNLIPATTLDTFALPVGTQVQIARVIRTPIGLRFRIINSLRWLGENDIQIHFDPNVIVDYVKIAAQNKALPNNGEGQNLRGFKPKKDCAKPKHVSTWRRENQKRTKTMDKKDLKEAIAGLTTGDQVTVTFLSMMPSGAANTRYDGIRDLAGRTMEFSLVETKKGRGKGGSQLMVLKSVDGEKVTFGTPHSEVLVNLTTPNGMVGHETEATVPKSFDTDSARAKSLKGQFKSLVGTHGAKVRLSSEEADYQGTFTVTEAEQLRGRHGQVRLSLVADDGREFQVWSYQHSVVITEFEVLSAGSAVVMETTVSDDVADAD